MVADARSTQFYRLVVRRGTSAGGAIMAVLRFRRGTGELVELRAQIVTDLLRGLGMTVYTVSLHDAAFLTGLLAVTPVTHEVSRGLG